MDLQELQAKDVIKELHERMVTDSNDPHKHVGAALCLGDKVLSVGFNHYIVTQDPLYELPREKHDESLNILKTKYPYMLHAEQCAIVEGLKILGSLPQEAYRDKDLELYCTYFPCNECAKLIINAGIKKIYVSEFPDMSKERYIVSSVLFTLCGISVEYVDKNFIISYKKYDDK